ncbi:MAG TPA: O-antigen ligase family protein [Solirubrobacteraceae bacterium]|jgi:O-antigen ligase|nr:O-antigen ligase family protein [Solirubrobacteraceae bacterium]
MIGRRTIERAGAGMSRRSGDRLMFGILAASGALAVLAGREAAAGDGTLVAVGAAATAFVVWMLARPEHAALAVLAVLPFLVYPASTGGLSLFAAVPLVGLVSIALLLSQRGSWPRLRSRLPVAAFGVLLLFAGVAAVHGSSISTAGSRLIYLALFALFAWALAASISAGNLSPRALAVAIVAGAGLASVALIIQVVIQFAAGQHAVVTWLTGEFPLFAGQRAASIAQESRNWVVGTLNVVRGIFPFMSAPSAGQYTMLGFVASVWLWRTRPQTISPAARSALMAAMILIAAGLLMTLSRQSWVGALAGVSALGLRRNPLRPVAVVALLFLFLAVIPIPGGHSTFGDYLLTASDTTTVSSATRLGLLSQAIHLIPGHWLIGVGPGLYGTLNPDPANPVYYAHNVWLDETVELGIGGGLALISVFVLTMRQALRRRAMLGFSMLAAFAVANLFDDVLYFPRNGIILAAAFALAATGNAIAAPQPADRSAL